MEIIRSLKRDGNLCPAAVNLLDAIPQSVLFFVQQQLRHPDSIYSMSLQKLGSAFLKVYDAYIAKAAEYRTATTSTSLEMSELLKHQEDFLRALQEHLDDCYLILKTLADPSSAKKQPIFADKYVIENKLPGAKVFHSNIAEYKRTLRIANKLKHQQGRLRGVALWLPNGPHLGYFLEEPDARGYIGPSPEIHPDQGAISFARDLSWHLFNVYSCSEKLAKAVITAVRRLDGTNLKPAVCATRPDWEKVVASACKIPASIFPKELSKHVASFQLDPTAQCLTIRFPETVKLVFPSPVTVTCSTVVDGHSRAFKVPFP